MLSIVIPVFNEEKTVAELLMRVLDLPIAKEVIVFDDASTDRTKSIVDTFARIHKSVFLFGHTPNMGKGAAIRGALKHVSGSSVVILDADMEYDPKDILELIKPIENGSADVVFGSRFLGNYKAVHLKYKLANKILTTFTNILYGRKLTDVYTCYKVFTRQVIDNLNLVSNRFEIEAEITAKVLKLGCRIHEVPISYHARSVSEGKKIKASDGFKGMFTLLKYRFKGG